MASFIVCKNLGCDIQTNVAVSVHRALPTFPEWQIKSGGDWGSFTEGFSGYKGVKPNSLLIGDSNIKDTLGYVIEWKSKEEKNSSDSLKSRSSFTKLLKSVRWRKALRHKCSIIVPGIIEENSKTLHYARGWINFLRVQKERMQLKVLRRSQTKPGDKQEEPAEPLVPQTYCSLSFPVRQSRWELFENKLGRPHPRPSEEQSQSEWTQLVKTSQTTDAASAFWGIVVMYEKKIDSLSQQVPNKPQLNALREGNRWTAAASRSTGLKNYTSDWIHWASDMMKEVKVQTQSHSAGGCVPK